MADAGNKTQTRAFFSAKNTGNSAKSRIQTALTYFAARRRQLITVCVLPLLLVVSRRMTVTHQYSRSCRRLERNNGWFSTVWSTVSTKQFKKTFRVSRETFGFILSRTRHVLERDTIKEEPISPECRLERQYRNYFKLHLLEKLETQVIRPMPFGTPFLKNYLQKKRNPLQHTSLLTHF